MVALVTPMDADGAVAFGDLGPLIDFHTAAGTEALIVAGTTGESATLEAAFSHLTGVRDVGQVAADLLSALDRV